MYKRVMRQLSLTDEAEMFGGIKLNPENAVRSNAILVWQKEGIRLAES